jgi:Fe-S cluster assembly ATP-binding protein
MLEINNLSVNVSSKEIIKAIDLRIKKGEIMVLFGPNGSGKSTLIKSIMGFNGYAIKKGEILFKGKQINSFSIDEREKLGLGIMYQHPPKIRGVKLGQIARFLCKDEKRIENLADTLSLKEHLHRDVNLDFSGGEMKRSELFQVLLQDPDLLLLDEPESGVDVENISIMGKVLNEYLIKPEKSALIITHTGYILDYINAEKGIVMIDGKFWCQGQPKEIFESIKAFGYEKCKECEWHKKI